MSCGDVHISRFVGLSLNHTENAGYCDGDATHGACQTHHFSNNTVGKI